MFETHAQSGGIVELRIDRQAHSHNVMDREAIKELDSVVEKLVSDASVTGIIVTSAKKTFVAGGDIDEIAGVRTEDAARDLVALNCKVLRRLETSGKPVVALIDGAALGGGLELAMACTARIASTSKGVVLGLPEVGLGLMPGAGGTQRLPYLVGVEQALAMALGGKPIKAPQALELGLIDALVPAEDMFDTAVQMIADGKVPSSQPWDRARYDGPLPDPATDEGRALLGKFRRLATGPLAEKDPAPAAIVSAMCAGLATDMDKALLIEQDHFARIASGAVAKNKIRTLFFGMNDAKNMAMRPEGIEKATIRKVGVLGAGLMGGGIANVAARAGFDVVLLDRSVEIAAKGKDAIAKACARDVSKGRLSEAAAEALVGRITPVDDYAALTDADIVIEAVSENIEIKHLVLAAAAAVLRPGVPLASNTSTLPIGSLATAVERPADVLGLHFFAPVERMPFVEVIRSDDTSDRTLAHALDFLAALRKAVVVVRDGLGFFTSRVVASYTGEALTMLAEGVDPQAIDTAALAAGMPLGPLAMADMTSLTLLKDIFASITGDGSRQGLAGVRANEALARMVDTFGRVGREAGAGIYDYADGKPAPWSDLTACFPPRNEALSPEEIEKRLMYAQALETARVMEEGIVDTPLVADVGSVLAWAFPSYAGGSAGYVDMIGVERFVEECRDMEQKFGGRFKPPAILVDMAETGARFHPA